MAGPFAQPNNTDAAATLLYRLISAPAAATADETCLERHAQPQVCKGCCCQCCRCNMLPEKEEDWWKGHMLYLKNLASLETETLEPETDG